MEPYIKKSEVVAEIEKYISNYKGILNKVDKSSYNWLDSAMSLESKIDVLQHLLSFLDTLEVKEVEVPVSNDLEEACDEYYDETWDEHGGKAMVVDGCHDIWFPSQATDDFFKAGAQWQKQQVIDKACQFLKEYQEYPNHDISTNNLLEAFKMYMEIRL